MICIKRVFETPEQAMRVKTQYHEALVGSPAYINSEIAIMDGDHPTEFYLVVGNGNEADMSVTWAEPGASAGDVFRAHITSRFSAEV